MLQYLDKTHGRKSFNFKSHSTVIENSQATGAYLIQITQLTLLNTTLDPSTISIWLYENIMADQYGQDDLNKLLKIFKSPLAIIQLKYFKILRKCYFNLAI